MFGAVDLPTIPQGIVDFFVGFGDGVSSVLSLSVYNTADFRNDFGIDGGVNECSVTYQYLKYVGYAWGAGTFGVAGLNGGANSVFYSPSLHAKDYAQILGKTIDKTFIGRIANKIGLKNNTAWRFLSRIYAYNAKGRAKAIVRNPRRSKATWDTVEKPILSRRKVPIDYY